MPELQRSVFVKALEFREFYQFSDFPFYVPLKLSKRGEHFPGARNNHSVIWRRSV
jgi:hypothetical protein